VERKCDGRRGIIEDDRFSEWEEKDLSKKTLLAEEREGGFVEGLGVKIETRKKK